MADNNNLLKEKADLIEKIKRIQSEQGKDAAKLNDVYIKSVDRLKDIVKSLKDVIDEQNKTVQNAVDLEQSSKSLGSMYSSISSKMRDQANTQRKLSVSIANELDNGKTLSTTKGDQLKIINDILSKYNEQSNLASKLSQLSVDDVVARQQLNDEISSIGNQIKDEVDLLDKRTNIAKVFLGYQNELESSISNQVEAANDLSSLHDYQKDILEQQSEIFISMKKTVSSIGSVLETFLVRPQAAIGATVIVMGSLVNKIGDVNKELGSGFDLLNGTNTSAGLLSFIFEDTAGTVKAITSEFGDASAATFSLQTNVGLMAKNMGISNTEAASLVGSFARLNGGSADIASDMVKTTQQFAKQNGIIPSALMADLASSAEEFALYGKNGGQNLLKAAGYAQKLGVNMKTLTGIADNLLDFESSITKELELGALLGRNINLNQARQLAYAGDIEGATKETLRALGGVDAFNRMDYFQKKATADLLGTSVAEMEKMVKNQEAAGSMGSVINEKFSKMNELLDTGLNQYLGTGLQGLGGMVVMAGQLGTGFKSINGLLNIGLIIKTKTWVGDKINAGIQLLKNGYQAISNSLSIKELGIKTKTWVGDKINVGIQLLKNGYQSISNSLSIKELGIKNSSWLASKLSAGWELTKIGYQKVKNALLGKEIALQTKKNIVERSGAVGGAVGVAVKGGGMAAMSAGLATLANPATLLGLAAITLAVIGIGYALKVAAPGIKAFGEAVASIVVSVGDSIKTILSGLSDFIMNISSIASIETALSVMGLSAAFISLAASLTAFSIAGLAAIPAMTAVSIFGKVNSVFGKSVGETSVETKSDTVIKIEELVSEIKGLRADLNSGKVAVYMDGKKVTSSVNRVIDRIGTNFYGAT